MTAVSYSSQPAMSLGPVWALIWKQIWGWCYRDLALLAITVRHSKSSRIQKNCRISPDIWEHPGGILAISPSSPISPIHLCRLMVLFPLSKRNHHHLGCYVSKIGWEILGGCSSYISYTFVPPLSLLILPISWDHPDKKGSDGQQLPLPQRKIRVPTSKGGHG